MEREDLNLDFIPPLMAVWIDAQKFCCSCTEPILPGKALRDGNCFFHNYGCFKCGHRNCGCGSSFSLPTVPCGAPRQLAVCAPHTGRVFEDTLETISAARKGYQHQRQGGPDEFLELHFRAILGEWLNASWERLRRLFRH